MGSGFGRGKMNNIRDIKLLPFELAYLTLLTRYNLKPLSRWEGDLSPAQVSVLGRFGLEVEPVRRYTLLGRRVPRTVFSMNTRYMEKYRSRFKGKRLKASPSVVRLEGWFFGYPSCCVEQFIREPYKQNELDRDDQRILFHWACPGCHTTRSLLREYRSVYRECVHMFGGSVPEEAMLRRFQVNTRKEQARAFRKALPWAASLAALILLPGPGGALDVDPHVRTAPDDQDGDGLSYAEEVLLGGSPSTSDSNNNGVLDGIDESLTLSALIAGLPRTPVPDAPYVMEFQMDGVEQCAVCGEWVDMGFIRIIHPLRDLVVDIPYIGLHYLEHGGLGYEGSLHEGRVDIARIKQILFPYDPSHIIPGYVYDDEDSDRLENNEEPLVSTDPDNPDTDGDSIEDGCQVAEELVAALSSLPREPRSDGPYIIEHRLWGTETCARCGDIMNMGWVEVVNPLEDFSLEIPFIALHYMAHGGFVYEGDVHSANRVLPSVLSTLVFGAGHTHWLPVEGDSDDDGLADDEEALLWTLPNNPDTDGDGVPDGPELATFLHEVVEGLPEGPLTGKTYIVHHPAYGVYECLVCGESINMGTMEIVNPVNGKSTWLSYYNDHFMSHGSFSTDRPDLYAREDILELADVLDVNVTGVGDQTPSSAVLSNAPNPFTAQTEITFGLPEGRDVQLVVFDAAGRKIQKIYSGPVLQGSNRFIWDGRDSRGRNVSSGVYFCKLHVGRFSLKRKMVKLR